MTETLGERMRRLLQVAVDLGYITQEEADEWCAHPPPNPQEARHRQFVLQLVKLGEE
jgi:hypothetical protein